MSVYWIDEFLGLVEKCPLAGCPQDADGGVSPTVLAQGRHSPTNIVIDGTSFYWTESGMVGKCPLARCPNGGTVPEVLSPTQGGIGLSIDATNVYWTLTGPTSGNIFECAIGGCGGMPVVLANVGGFNTATDGVNVYWNNAGNGTRGLIERCGISGCPQMPLVLASGLNAPTGIAVDSSAVYWTTDYAGGSIMRLAK
jgi:hypothetical protein